MSKFFFKRTLIFYVRVYTQIDNICVPVTGSGNFLSIFFNSSYNGKKFKPKGFGKLFAFA